VSRSTCGRLGDTEDIAVDQFYWPGSGSTQPGCRSAGTASVAFPRPQLEALQGNEECVETALYTRFLAMNNSVEDQFETAC
jgi:hypothetical protein